VTELKPLLDAENIKTSPQNAAPPCELFPACKVAEIKGNKHRNI